MAVLVTAASKHGATVEIANVIARKLNEHGASAELVDIEDMSELDCYEAVVIGSGIYLGNWLKEARRVIDAHAAELSQRPTWLFASGPHRRRPTGGLQPERAAPRPSSPIPLTLPARRWRGWAVDRITSTTRLFFSSTTPLITH